MAVLGSWTPGLAAILMIVGIGVGALVYLLSGTAQGRVSPSFVGGEPTKYEAGNVVSMHLYPSSRDAGELIGGVFDYEGLKIPSSHFYDSIKAIAFFREMYKIAGNRFFDLYEQINKPFLMAIRGLKKVHDGVLTTYIGLSLLGGAVIVFLLLVFHFRPV